EGFLPAKTVARRQRLEHLRGEPRTLIFYEAPHRLRETLRDKVEVIGGERIAALARGLTKLHETAFRAPWAALCARVGADPNQCRGECVLLLRGCEESAAVDADSERVLRVLLDELPLKQAAALAARITGRKKNELYQLALRWRDE